MVLILYSAGLLLEMRKLTKSLEVQSSHISNDMAVIAVGSFVINRVIVVHEMIALENR